METVWFVLVALMIAGYVILDGFDLGAGIVHFGAARTEAERRQVLQSIGPVWDGNEVWLLAGGGTLYMAFPVLYAASFSGFYLPLMMVLWLLILRGIAIEFRSHVEGPVWGPLWDAVFCGSSILLAIFFGAALGNVVRGVPLDASGRFFLPLWTNFGATGEVGILDWYTISVGVLAFLTLTQHGALWVALKTDDPVRGRARRIAGFAWIGVAVMTLVVTHFTMQVQPLVREKLHSELGIWIFPLLALAGLAGVAWFRFKRRELAAFLSSSVFIAGMLCSAAFGLYPYVLPSNVDPQFSLSIHNASAGPHGLSVGMMWWLPGMLIALGYIAFVYRRFGGKVSMGESRH
ncbi:MAG TPA: cytochrome d ubiquinol oxidase subunit II [Bryobacteraceae bacterium]|nr:cytochrome d ubiquinol oxidase subunit II [Bryobacteraceae bacterium]